MFDTLLGTELPPALRFFIAFLLVLILIGATTWAVRRFGGHRLTSAANRGRQPRLAVIDSTAVDARRRLILIRRDNIEHLLMVGGPTDIVVEPNIVRAVAVSREAPVRAAPMPDRATIAPAETMMSPLQPDSLPTRGKIPADEAPEPTPRPRPLEGSPGPAPEPARPAPPVEPRAERKPSVEPVRMAEPEPPRTPAPAAEIPVVADHNLAEMAQRLEAALRRPAASATKPAAAAEPAPKTETVVSFTARAHADTASQGEKPARAEARSVRAEPKSAKSGHLDSLEQEMASLLSRPAARQ